MIHLDFNRNKFGCYVLDPEQIKKQYECVCNINEITHERPYCNYWIKRGDNKVLVKSTDGLSDEYLLLIYSELLFSKFAEKNNIPCAKSDIGYFDNKYFTLSQNVVKPELESFSVKKLREFCGVDGDIKSTTIKEIYNLLWFFSEKVGAEIDENCLQMLNTTALVDFITGQSDRNITNILFAIEEVNNKKFIKAQGLIDNERGFGLDLLVHLISCQYINSDVVYMNNERSQRRIQKLMKEAMKLSKDSLPLLGIKTSVRLDMDELGLKEFFSELFKGTKTNKIRQVFFDEITEEIIKEPQLLKFFKNLKFDAISYGQEIYNETGLKIPELYLEFANEVVETRYNMLNSSLEDKQQEQKEH